MTRKLLLQKICPNACINDCRFIGCSQCNEKLNEWLDEYDKQIRAKAINDYYNTLNEKTKADTNLKDTIREIHDRVAQEMYCKAIDDFLTEICKIIVQSENNGNYRFYAVEIKQSIADLAEQLKAGGMK